MADKDPPLMIAQTRPFSYQNTWLPDLDTKVVLQKIYWKNNTYLIELRYQRVKHESLGPKVERFDMSQVLIFNVRNQVQSMCLNILDTKT